MSEKKLPILMACRLLVRYVVNQLRAVPDIPYHVDMYVMRMSWLMVSKAVDRSKQGQCSYFANINVKVYIIVYF